MNLLETIHRPDGMRGVVSDLIPCTWEYKLPSGKTGTCGAMATWELVYSTDIPQPFGAAGCINIHNYRCDRHPKEEQ